MGNMKISCSSLFPASSSIVIPMSTESVFHILPKELKSKDGKSKATPTNPNKTSEQCKKTTGGLGCIGDEKLPSDVGIFINHEIRIPIKQLTNGFFSHSNEVRGMKFRQKKVGTSQTKVFFGLFFLFLLFLFLLLLCFLQNDWVFQACASNERTSDKYYLKDDGFHRSDRCCNGLPKKQTCSRAPRNKSQSRKRKMPLQNDATGKTILSFVGPF